MEKEKNYEQAITVAVKLLGYRARTRKEIERKLEEKGCNEEVCAAVIVRLEELGYIDDIAFAKLFIESKSGRKNYGKKWIQHQLAQKGINKNDIAAAFELSGFENEENETENPEQQAANRALEKWARNREFDNKKAFDFLARRGFSRDIISKALKTLES